jgi:hypothetical protein
MAGYDGDLTREAVEQAARQQGAASIRVLGPVEGEAKWQLLMASDAFVSLSWRDNFGYSLADAAAHGLCGAYAPDHAVVADLPEQYRRWVAEDHSLREAAHVLQAILATASTIREESAHVGQIWATDSLARTRFKEVDRQEAALRLQES